MICEHCSKDFEPKTSNQKFCSRSCGDSVKHKRFRQRHGYNKYGKLKACQQCHRGYKSRFRKQKFCSRPCAALAKKKYLDIPQCLENASRKLDKNIGYVRVYCPMHPSANTWGYVYEHRLIMEGVLGRHLGKQEHVHHKNGKRWDNRPENLEVLTSSEHMKKTQAELRAYSSAVRAVDS